MEDEVRRILELHREDFEEAGLLNTTAIARFLAGSSSKRLPGSWRTLPGFGALSGTRMRTVRKLVDGALREEIAPETACVPASGDNSVVSHDGPREEVFWESAKRAFTRVELESRSVPRQRGLWILELIQSRADGLAPSRIACILRGDAQYPRPRGAGLRDLPQWGRLADLEYQEVLQDVLAMWAKGYLRRAAQKSKRLVLSGNGQLALEGRPR
jgi:hypothetical protein